MNLPDGLLDGRWTLLAWLPFAALAWFAARQAHHGRCWPRASVSMCFWQRSSMLTLLWHLQAGVRPGLSLHLLGATVFTLCFGWALAFHRTLPGPAGGESERRCRFRGLRRQRPANGGRRRRRQSRRPSSGEPGAAPPPVRLHLLPGFLHLGAGADGGRWGGLPAAGAGRRIRKRVPEQRVPALFSFCWALPRPGCRGWHARCLRSTDRICWRISTMSGFLADNDLPVTFLTQDHDFCADLFSSTRTG
jgi:hypothetical protein